MVVLLAIISLAFAAVNDVIFRLYARRQQPIGLYLAIIGGVYTLFFVILAANDGNYRFNGAGLQWGLISGCFSAAANILLVMSMAKNEAGMCSAIYRLNLAPAALLAFLLLGEPATVWNLFAIAFAVIAVFLFFSTSSASSSSRLSLLLVVLASLLRAGMGVSYKMGLTHGGGIHVILTCNGVMWMVSGLAYCLLRERSRPILSGAAISFGLGSGMLVCGIVLTTMLALKIGQASNVLPISQLSFMGTAIIGVVFLKETLTRKKLAGLTMAVLCVIFMLLDVGHFYK